MEALLPALKHALKQIKGDKREKHPRHVPHAEAAPVDEWERSYKSATSGSKEACSCGWSALDKLEKNVQVLLSLLLRQL